MTRGRAFPLGGPGLFLGELVMSDIAYKQTSAPALSVTASSSAYLAMVQRKRMYGGLLLVIFVALMASGFLLAEHRNAGGFVNGLPREDI